MCKKFKFTALTLITCFLFLLPSSAQETSQTKQFELENGLKVFLYKRERLPLINLAFAVNLGSKNETDETSGLVHILEHYILFRGTEFQSGAEIIQDIRRHGAYFNAHTGHDLAIFELTIPSEYADFALKNQKEILFNLKITQEELDGILRKGKLEKPERIVMIQCVGARKGEIRPSSLLAFPKSNTAELLRKIFKARKEEGWPYCSRICCMNAIKNAILLKKSSPFTDVVILFGDLRVYKEYEDLYKTARDLEVRFIRHFEEIPPEITQISGDKLQVLACDSLSGLEVKFKADMVVLSTPLRPRRSEVLIAKMLKVPIGSDGFLMEAHLKLRPVDTNVDGVFIAGAVSGPKDIPESIISAEAAAARASILMGNQKVRAEAITAYASDDLCIGCGLCEEICPYGAPIIVEGKSNIREIICRGCGICAAECPMQAINMRHFENNQILSQIKSLLFLENSKGGIV